MKKQIKNIFKKIIVKEKPIELIIKNKQVTFRTTEYVYDFLTERSKCEGKTKSDIINEILDYEAYRYNKRKELD